MELGSIARRALGNAASPLFYRLVDGRARSGRRRAFVKLMETRDWPLEKLRELQEQQLRRLLTHAVEVSPWYREKLRDVPDPARFRIDDLRHLPILEKSELLIAQEFLPTTFDWRIGICDGQPLYACKYHHQQHKRRC